MKKSDVISEISTFENKRLMNFKMCVISNDAKTNENIQRELSVFKNEAEELLVKANDRLSDKIYYYELGKELSGNRIELKIFFYIE